MKTFEDYKKQQMQDPELEVIRKRNDTRREDIKNELQF